MRSCYVSHLGCDRNSSRASKDQIVIFVCMTYSQKQPSGNNWIVTSVVVVRGQQLCLLDRLSFLGPGAKTASQRRALALRLHERRQQDAQTYRLAHCSRGARGVGRAFVEQ